MYERDNVMQNFKTRPLVLTTLLIHDSLAAEVSNSQTLEAGPIVLGHRDAGMFALAGR